MELEEEGAPLTVTLIRPAAIDTPFTRHARNYMDAEPDFPPPVYAPEVVAETILHCATHAERDIVVGGGGKKMTSMGNLMPRGTDRYMEATQFDAQQKDQPQESGRRDSLFNASEDLSERGDYQGHVRESSIYTRAALHPWVTGALMVGAGLAVASIFAAVRDDS
jgi:hypothetical protein